jgi:hypothetical protein
LTAYADDRQQLAVLNLIFEKVKTMARPAFRPTEEQTHLVKGMSSFGIRQQYIATWVGLRPPKTLRKHFREELDMGGIGADTEVGKTLYRMAISGKHSSAMFFHLHRQASRRARLMRVTNPVTAPDFVVTREQEAA